MEYNTALMKEYIADGWRVVDWFAYCPILERGENRIVLNESQTEIILRYNMEDRQVYEVVEKAVSAAIKASTDVANQRFDNVGLQLQHMAGSLKSIDDRFRILNGKVQATIERTSIIEKNWLTRHLECPNAVVLNDNLKDVAAIKQQYSEDKLITATRTEIKKDFNKLLLKAVGLLVSITALLNFIINNWDIVSKLWVH